MTILHIDFETFSRIDLKARGLDVYARDASTGVHCMAYVFDEDVDVEIWCAGQCNPATVLRHVAAGGLVYAHNAAFELAIWNHIMVPRYGWPVLKVEQVRCTMVMAYAMALPGALAAAAPALGLEQRKDTVGGRVMMVLATPKRDGSLWKHEDDPAKFKILYDYCKQDVEVERALHHRLMELSPSEQKLWELDQRINQSGILVDLPAIDQALTLVASEKKRLDAEMLRVTGGVVGACTEVKLLVQWIRLQGVTVKGLAKADVLDALDGEGLPANVRQALELRKEAAKSSTAKLLAMKQRAAADSRVRGIHQFHGASTGRWAGRGVQTQNLPRTRPGVGPQEVEAIIAHLGNRDYLDAFYGPVLDALADSLRGMIVAPKGKELLAVDFKSVEAVVLAWLAGEQSVLNTYARKEDLYIAAAAAIYHVPAAEIGKHDPRRQIGKVSVLACGYGGGVGAFQSMAKVYNVKVPDAEAEQIKKAWRAAHPAIVRYWRRVETAFRAAMTEGGAHCAGPAGRQVTFKKKGSFLWCQLPSGRVLCYPYPEINACYEMELKANPPKFKKAHPSERDAYEAKKYVVVNTREDCIWYMSVNGTTNKWEWAGTYGGSLAENVTQAVARDLLAESMLRLAERGEKIVAHVHDEAVLEVEPGTDVKTYEALMAQTPAWAVGLPLAAEGWRGPRYRK